MTMKDSVYYSVLRLCITFGCYCDCLQGVLLTLLAESNSGNEAKHFFPNLAQGKLYDCTYCVEHIWARKQVFLALCNCEEAFSEKYS